jgi:transposase InsO family protein
VLGGSAGRRPVWVTWSSLPTHPASGRHAADRRLQADRRAPQRERRSAGEAAVNVKRVYRLMKKHGMLLARHTGRRRPRDGQVATIRSNVRWCSDALEFACWNGEIVPRSIAMIGM